MNSDSLQVIHVVAAFTGSGGLADRQRLFFESVQAAERDGVHLITATASENWRQDGWVARTVDRDARSIGDTSDKPFVKDLLDIALEYAAPDDWLLYSNVDCGVASDIYSNLRARRGCVVEYMRRDVEGSPRTLVELFSNPGQLYSVGIDGLAIRAAFYTEIRQHLPDFIVGSPHWDTTYSGIMRKLVPVQRDAGRLFHPKHEPWSLSHTDAASRHNDRLFVEALTSGYADQTMIREEPNVTDSAVTVVSFGRDPARIEANTQAIRRQLRQDLYADFYLVELMGNEPTSAYPSDILAQVNHVPVVSSAANEDLFQKEALMNIGWRKALETHPYEYFVFVDADVYSERPDWFRKIRDRLRENPAAAVQGFRVVQDTRDPEIRYSSVGSFYAGKHQTDLSLNPGLCWGLHRWLLEMGDGFNSLCMTNAGDSTFVAEYLNAPDEIYDPFLYQFHWFHEIKRDLPYRAVLDAVDVDLIHVNHGPWSERDYDVTRFALDGLPSIGTLVELDHQGVLRWVEPESAERRIFRLVGRMKSREAVQHLFKESGYPRQHRNGTPPRPEIKPRAGFRPPARWSPPPAWGSAERAWSGRRNRDVLQVFDPQRVFRKDFPFSWCDRVVKEEGRTYIPISTDGPWPTLVLEGLPDAGYIVGSLPFQPSWQPVDLTRFCSISFRILAPKLLPADIVVHISSEESPGVEHDSAAVSLLDFGLRQGEWSHITIGRDSFAEENGFALRTARILKFVGYASMRIELAEILVEKAASTAASYY